MHSTHKKKLKIKNTNAKFYTVAIFFSKDLQLGLSKVRILLFSLTRLTIVTATVIKNAKSSMSLIILYRACRWLIPWTAKIYYIFELFAIRMFLMGEKSENFTVMSRN